MLKKLVLNRLSFNHVYVFTIEKKSKYFSVMRFYFWPTWNEETQFSFRRIELILYVNEILFFKVKFDFFLILILSKRIRMVLQWNSFSVVTLFQYISFAISVRKIIKISKLKYLLVCRWFLLLNANEDVSDF